MQSNKKRNIIIGIIISVLLSLFVNYSLFALNFEVEQAGDMLLSSSSSANDKYLLLFSFLWFAALSFILYLLTVKGIALAKRLLRKEYKAILLVALFDVLLIFLVIQLYTTLEAQFADAAVFSIAEGEDGTLIVNEISGDIAVGVFSFSGEQIQEHFDPGAAPDSASGFEPGMQLGHDFVPTISETIYRRPVITEHLFILVTVFMFVLLMRMLDSKQELALKIEKLQKENLQSSYNALMGQVNPHFFFNSLGGLNSLIRSGEQERTLTYLEELTSVFRYILQSNHKEIVFLAEELDFVKAYIYLMGIRYEGKLSFSLDIGTAYLSYRLPVLSLLPLVENAIKHNVVSKSSPLHISVFVNADKNLVVSNPLQPKAESSECTGIGLQNLSGRYGLLTGRDITITKQNEQFEVQLPLLEPLENQ